jgi:hypothetical protein
MKSIIKIGLVGLVGIFMFTGCASTPTQVAYVPIPKNMKLAETKGALSSDIVYIVNSINMEDSKVMAANRTVDNINGKFMIQADAMTTIKSGYKYFRIINPIDTSSEMFSTAKELHDRCFGFTLADDFGKEFLGKKKRTCSFELSKKAAGYFGFSKRRLFNVIAVYKNKPNDILTINAQEVLDYLKANDLYTNFKYKDINKELIKH